LEDIFEVNLLICEDRLALAMKKILFVRTGRMYDTMLNFFVNGQTNAGTSSGYQSYAHRIIATDFSD
jgi:hypothetical protein